MLPKIKMIPTLKNPISLNKREIPKINIPFSYNYIENSPSKKNISKSLINNASNSFTKGSKLFNASTKNNSINNSYFKENLYYYPPHYNKFSYMKKLSSQAVLYEDFNFNKAPSLKKNFHGIHKMMKDRRISKIKYLDNLFSMSMTGNNFPHSFSTKNNEFEINNNNTTNKFLVKNNSCEELKSKTLNNKKLINYVDSEIKNYSPYKIITHRETKSSSDKLESINNYPSPTKNEFNKNSSLPTSERKTEYTNYRSLTNRQTFSITRSGSFITDLNTKKFNFNINDCIFESKIKIKNLSAFALKVLNMKIFQGLQKNTLNCFFEKHFQKLKNHINHVETNFEKYKNVCEEFNYQYTSYIKFLKKTVIDMGDENKSLISKKINLTFEIEDILNENIKTQNELEKLIDMRNFLYKARHKGEEIPDIYSTFYIESKRYLLAKLFINLFGETNNITVMKYLSNLPGEIIDENSVSSSKFYVEQCPPLIGHININKKNDVQIINDIRGKKKKSKINKIDYNNVFTSYDEFISLMKHLEDKNRNSLIDNEINLGLIIKYKENLENIKTPDEIEIEEKLRKLIEIKDTELKKLKKKNLELTKEYNEIFATISEEDLFNKKEISLKKDDGNKSSFQDLTYFQTVNYNSLVKRAKYSGLVFFQKILKSYLLLMKLYSDNKDKTFYIKTHPECLEDIIKFSSSQEGITKVSYFIIKYILKILELYEYLWDYISKKNQIYESDEKNLVAMKKQQDLISDQRKLENARTLRKLIEKRRNNENKKLIEKWLMPPKYVGRGNDVDTYIRKLYKSKRKGIKGIKPIMKKIVKINTNTNENDDSEALLCYD